MHILGCLRCTEGEWRSGGALEYFLGGYVPPGTPNWRPVLKKIPLKLIPRSRNGQFFLPRSRIRPKTDTPSG